MSHMILASVSACVSNGWCISTGVSMIRVLISTLFMLVISSNVSAAGWALNYSVNSYKEAQQVVQQQPQKHILVYYANASR